MSNKYKKSLINIFTEQLEEKALSRLNNSKCGATIIWRQQEKGNRKYFKELNWEEDSQPRSITVLLSCKTLCEKEKILLKGICFTFLQEVTYHFNSNCGAFILHYRIINTKHIQPKSFKTELKINSLFFMPSKAVGRHLQRLIMVYKVFWLWEFDHSCKVLDDVSVKYSV